MIPLYKLEKLPRIQRLRKIAKVFMFAENRLCTAVEKKADIFTEAEFIFYIDASSLLSLDVLFSEEARKVFREASNVFSRYANNDDADQNFAMLTRAFNNVKHLLLTETGKDQADWDFTVSSGSLDPAVRQINEGMYVYLEDIRSPFNVGALFRTAESFGVEKIILSPFCADPRHRRAQRTAMGCIDIMPWERQPLFSEIEITLADNKGEPLPVFALETGGIPINEFHFPRRGLLIAGSEELGASPKALEAADASLGRVTIPINGVKASLNVSVAFGIALHNWRQSIKQSL
ncbi:MAG: TrmH family RNA methyltransferase [Treponema sp.]|nr:TrmH family RNA methyltransferase [Treponema sp.]MCL2272359.1 TrmH family RNA methyltransferase [Treponema sp.]